MPYTSDPSNNPVDAVRLEIGDRGATTASEFLTDEEYEYFLDKAGNDVSAASVLAARGVAALFSQLADEEAGEIKVKWSQKARAFLALADAKLEELTSGISSGSHTPTPMTTGTSLFNINSRQSNTDRPRDIFSSGFSDNMNG